MKNNKDPLLTEYEQLHEVILQDRKMANTVISIILPASVLVLVWVVKGEFYEFSMLLSACITSVAAVIVAYAIERRSDLACVTRIGRLNLIEKDLGMWNHRIFDHRVTIPLELEGELRLLKRKGYSVFSGISAHNWFKMYIVFFIISWLIIIYNFI